MTVYLRPRKQARKDSHESNSALSPVFPKRILHKDTPSYTSSPVTGSLSSSASASATWTKLATHQEINIRMQTTSPDSDDDLSELFASQSKVSSRETSLSSSELDLMHGPMDKLTSLAIQTFQDDAKECVQSSVPSSAISNSRKGVRMRPTCKKGIDHLPRNVSEMIAREQSFQLFMRRRRIVTSARGGISYEDESQSEHANSNDGDGENDSDYKQSDNEVTDEEIKPTSKRTSIKVKELLENDEHSSDGYESLARPKAKSKVANRSKLLGGYQGDSALSDRSQDNVESDGDIFEVWGSRDHSNINKVNKTIPCTFS